MMNKKNLESVISDSLQLGDFRKKGMTWYRQRKESLQVLNLQKSSYGDQYYLNLCFVPTGMEVEGLPTPKEHKCPIRIRLTSIFDKDFKSEVESLLDLERESASDVIREIGIRDLCKSQVIPFLDEIEKVGLKNAIVQGRFANGAVTLAAKRFMGILE